VQGEGVLGGLGDGGRGKGGENGWKEGRGMKEGE
jgi:hypothetical protein